MAATGDRQRGDLLAATGEDLMAIDSSLTETVAMLGICEIAAGVFARGVTLLAAASNVDGPIGTVHMPDVRVEAPVHMDLAHSALGEVACASAFAKGQAMTVDEAIAYALSASE